MQKPLYSRGSQATIQTMQRASVKGHLKTSCLLRNEALLHNSAFASIYILHAAIASKSKMSAQAMAMLQRNQARLCSYRSCTPCR
jgi:hypothetical protein